MKTTKPDPDEIEAPWGSEMEMADILVDQQLILLRHVAAWNRWYIWDGTRWKVDEKRKAFSLAGHVVREVAQGLKEPGKNRHPGAALATARTRAAVLSLASDSQKIAATIDQWDANPDYGRRQAKLA